MRRLTITLALTACAGTANADQLAIDLVKRDQAISKVEVEWLYKEGATLTDTEAQNLSKIKAGETATLVPKIVEYLATAEIVEGSANDMPIALQCQGTIVVAPIKGVDAFLDKGCHSMHRMR